MRDAQTFVWTVTNPAPTATDDTNTTSENVNTSGDVLTNDSDPDGDALSVLSVNGLAGNVGSGVTGTNGGTFTLQSDGSYTFVPGTAFDDLAVGESRQTSVTYVVTDSQGGTSSATVTITVNGTNDGPTSTSIADQTDVDNTGVTLDVSGSFSDMDTSDVLSFSAGGTLPPGLSIDSNTGVISGTLAANASVGSPYSVTITATDPTGAVTTQTFVWTVTNPGSDRHG